MWCASCQDDVATEISEDGQSLKCISCGEPVRQVFTPSLHPETKSARDLLQKWAEEQKLQLSNTDAEPSQQSELATAEDLEGQQSVRTEADVHQNSAEQISEIEANNSKQADETQPVVPAETTPTELDSKQRSSTEKSKPKYRIDSAHEEAVSSISPQTKSTPKRTRSKPKQTSNAGVSPTPQETRPVTGKHSTDPENSGPVSHYTDHQAHEDVPAPHFDVVAASKKAKSRPGRSEAIWGQLMAYAGVGVLTVGTVMVLWGYFGMIESYASTGWLLSTAGQMLLLLGIVTLVSGGMQQTTHEVTERIEYLGGRMIRIEQSTDQLLNGPHFSQQKNKAETTSHDGEKTNSV